MNRKGKDSGILSIYSKNVNLVCLLLSLEDLIAIMEPEMRLKISISLFDAVVVVMADTTLSIDLIASAMARTSTP